MSQLIDFANEVEHEMRTTIIQAVEVAPGRYGECLHFGRAFAVGEIVLELNYNASSLYN